MEDLPSENSDFEKQLTIYEKGNQGKVSFAPFFSQRRSESQGQTS